MYLLGSYCTIPRCYIKGNKKSQVHRGEIKHKNENRRPRKDSNKCEKKSKAIICAALPLVTDDAQKSRRNMTTIIKIVKNIFSPWMHRKVTVKITARSSSIPWKQR